MKRTSSYLGTLPYETAADRIEVTNAIAGTRDFVKYMNARLKSDGSNLRYRLVARGRLGKNNPNAHLYRRGGPLFTYTSQVIKTEHATRLDLYLQRRR